jgi:4-amino-4-deoxy-L-arabinose transferase-like glycosyltransferase
MFKFSDTAKILIILILLFIPWLGLRDFQSRGESREALVALSMYNTSDYILPLSYSDTIPSKPPLLHWLINLSIETFGSVNEFVFRLPVALASIIFLFYFYQFLLRNKPEVAFISTLILATSFQWFRHTTLVRVDLLLSVGISLAVFALYDYIVNKRRSLLLVYLGLTIAILSKGPVGILLPFINFFKILFWNFIYIFSINFIRSYLVQFSLHNRRTSIY